MARARVISTAVLTLGAFPRLFLPCLRLLAMVGAVVLMDSSVGVLVVFAFAPGRRKQVR